MKLRLLLLATLLISWNIQSKEIQVVTEYLAPFQIKNPDGTLGGFSTSVIRELFKLTNDKANISVLPWARAYLMAQSDESILIYSIARTQLRENNFNWVGSLLSERYYFWGLKERFNKSDYSINELKKLNIATVRNSNRHEYLVNSNFENVHALINEEQQLNMLFERRTDLVVEAELTLFEVAKNQQFDTSIMKKIVEISDLNANLSIAFSKSTNALLVEKYKKAYKQLEQNGTLLALKIKWNIPLNEAEKLASLPFTNR